MRSLSGVFYRTLKELYKKPLIKLLAELSGKAFSKVFSSF